MEFEQIITLIAAIAALGSAYWAWSSSHTAKQSLNLSEENASLKREKIKPYLITSLRWQGDERTYVSFACSYTNSSHSPNTISRIDLIVHAFTIQGRAERILLTSVPNIPINSEFSVLPIPLNLDAMSTISGWLTFELPKKSLGELIIDKYEVSATTATGGRITLNSYLILERVLKNER